jgi:hypothetical protein
MQRNMDLIREILLACESDPTGYPRFVPEIQNFTPEQVKFHIYLMGDAGLLRVADTTSLESNSPSAAILSVTWKGYDFLDTAKSSTVWEGAKGAISTMGGAGLDIWVDVMKFLAKEQLKKIGIDL